MDCFSQQVAALASRPPCALREPRVRDDVAVGIVRYVLLVTGPDGLTREQMADTTGMRISQVRRVTRRMAGEVYAVGEGFGGARTVRYSLARPAHDGETSLRWAGKGQA